MSFAETLWKAWAEVLFIFLLIIGFFIALVIQSPVLNYLVIFAVGLMAGRLIFMKKGKQPLFPFFLIILGFLLGYALGSVIVHRAWVTILFVLGAIVSYYLHKKGYIPS